MVQCRLARVCRPYMRWNVRARCALASDSAASFLTRRSILGDRIRDRGALPQAGSHRATRHRADETGRFLDVAL